MYFERHLEENLETFVPPDLSSSMHIDGMKEVGVVTGGRAAMRCCTFQIVTLLELCNPFVKKLDIKQLLPGNKGAPPIEEEETERFRWMTIYMLYVWI